MEIFRSRNAKDQRHGINSTFTKLTIDLGFRITDSDNSSLVNGDRTPRITFYQLVQMIREPFIICLQLCDVHDALS